MSPVPIVNATESLVVEVVARDIRGARPRDPKRCAFARACRREHPTLVEAEFWKTVALLSYPDVIVRYQLPPSMQKEVVALDRGGTFAAGTYRLAPMSPSYCRKPTGKVGGKKGGAGKPQSRHVTIMVRGTE